MDQDQTETILKAVVGLLTRLTTTVAEMAETNVANLAPFAVVRQRERAQELQSLSESLNTMLRSLGSK